jgi:hypothetical protein
LTRAGGGNLHGWETLEREDLEREDLEREDLKREVPGARRPVPPSFIEEDGCGNRVRARRRQMRPSKADSV